MKKIPQVLLRVLVFVLAFSLCLPVSSAFAQVVDPPSGEMTSATEESELSSSESAVFPNDTELSAELLKDCSVLNYVDRSEFLSAGHVARLTSLETLSSYAFLNADGSNTIYYFEHPVKFVDEKGEIREIDLSLRKNASGIYQTASNEISLALSENPIEGVTLTKGNYKVTLSAWTDGQPTLKSENSEKTSAGIAIAKNNTLTYQNLFGKGIDVRYTPLYDGVKEDILLDSFTGQTNFVFQVTTNGLSAYEDDFGRYYFAEDEGLSERILLGDVVAYDANAEMDEGSLLVEELEESNLYRVTVQMDVDFLAHAAYPVTIDPTLTFSDSENGSGAIEDCPIYQDRPTKNHETYLYNPVGNAGSGYGVGRTAIRLKAMINSSVYKELSASNVTSVSFYVMDASGGSKKTVGIHPLTSNSSWTESGLTWNNVGNYDSQAITSELLGSGATTVFDLTALVKGWKQGSYNEQCGFLMIGSDETVNRHFYSSESSTSSQRPYVVLEYHPTVNIPSYVIVPEGKTVKLTATTIPSGVQFSWYDFNQDIATVSSNGTVTAIASGIASIGARIGESTTYCTVYVIPDIADATYFVKNMQTGRYMEIEGYSTVSGGVIQQWDLHGKDQSRWIFKRQSDGYYTIQSVYSGLYVGVENGSTDQGAAIKQYSTSTAYYVRWIPMRTDNGGIRLIPKSSQGSPSNRGVISVEKSADANGTNLYHYRYTSGANDLRDEWDLIRMLPTNGDELEYDESAWAGLPMLNNCYAYALNNQVTEPTGNQIWIKQQPGGYYNNHCGSSDPIPTGYQDDKSMSENAKLFEEAVTQDFIKYNAVNGKSLKFMSIGRYEKCPAGTYKVALVLSNGDFHWYRQDLDGLWSHKPGITSVRREDDSGKLIIDPQLADRGDYTYFVGYYAVSPWNNMYDSPEEAISISEDVVSMPVSDKLLSNVQVGMSYSEVTEMLKNNGIDIGRGMIIQQYRSSNGAVYTFKYQSTETGFTVSNIIIGG